MLNQRLLKIAKLIQPCEVLIDIGSDHGFLPIQLLREGIIEKAIIADINPKPLQASIKNAEKYHVAEKCLFVLSNGLQSYRNDVDAMVIAGMGYETITQIFNHDMEQIKRIKQIVIQSNTHIDKLRLFLMQSQFKIVDEELVKDRKHFYVILKLEYCNQPILFDESDHWIGPVLKHRNDALMFDYLLRLFQNESKILKAQKKESSLKIQVIQKRLDAIQTS